MLPPMSLRRSGDGSPMRRKTPESMLSAKACNCNLRRATGGCMSTSR